MLAALPSDVRVIPMAGDNSGSAVLVLEGFLACSDKEFEAMFQLGEPKEPQSIKMFGKEVELSRRAVVHGEPYKFAGFSNEPKSLKDMHPVLLRAYNKFKALFPWCGYNTNLVNYYPPEGYIGKHSDDEPSMKKQPIISGTFCPTGSSRRMQFTPKKHVKGSRLMLSLRNGDVVIMFGDKFQEDYKHEIMKPKKKDPSERHRRINFTMRAL